MSALHARTMAFGFAARQRLGLRCKIEKPLPADEQVGDDAGRTAVETCVRQPLAPGLSGVPPSRVARCAWPAEIAERSSVKKRSTGLASR